MLSLHSAITKVFIDSLPCSVHGASYPDTAPKKMDNFYGFLEQRMTRGAIPTHSSSTQISVRKPGPDITEVYDSSGCSFLVKLFCSGKHKHGHTLPATEELMCGGVSHADVHTRATAPSQTFNLPAPHALILASGMRLDLNFRIILEFPEEIEFLSFGQHSIET